MGYFVEAFRKDDDCLDSTTCYLNESSAIHAAGEFFMDWGEKIRSGDVVLALYREKELGGELELIRWLTVADYFDQ